MSRRDQVRDEMGLTNLKLMIPFCRTVEEGHRVQAEMAKHGLRRGEKGLEIYVMCEIPSNVILADEFADIFDGFSIGSNDLTQLVLGVEPRQRHRCSSVRRTKSGRKENDSPKPSPPVAPKPQDWHLRSGSQRLPRLCAVSGGTRYR